MTKFLAQSLKLKDCSKPGRSSPEGLPGGQLRREKEESRAPHFLVGTGGAQSKDKAQTQNEPEAKPLLLSNDEYNGDSEALNKAKYLSNEPAAGTKEM